MLPLIALTFADIAILISPSQQNLDQYEMCEMSETGSIEPDGDCLDILDIGEVFTYTILSFSVIHVQMRHTVISSYRQTTDAETIKTCKDVH